MTPPRNPPHTVQVLQRWITEAERDTGIAVARQQRWVSYMILAAMLDQVQDEDDQPLFLLKGGVALELRLGLQARATKDYDTAFRAEMEDLLDHLDEVLRAGHGDFTAERTALEPVGETPAKRTTIKLSYRGRSWASVKFEVAPAEGKLGHEIERVAARPLDHLGLEGPQDVPCVAIRWQIAQKLHACTEILEGDRRNDRFRDFPDILMLWDLVEDDERFGVQEACEEIFRLRDQHEWPPEIIVLDHWPEPYRVLAEEMQSPIVDVNEAAAAVREIVDDLATGDHR
jgi:hypothetical protein